MTDDISVAVIMLVSTMVNGPPSMFAGEVRCVGKLCEILEVQFYCSKVVLMSASWVPKGNASEPTIARDHHGFWIANFVARPRDLANLIIFPSMVSQVCRGRTHIHCPIVCIGCQCIAMIC